MKKKFMIASLTLAALVAQADPGPADGQFAVLKPRLSCEVKIPAGDSHSQIYFSQDCQTAYVLPSQKMKKTVLKPLLLSDYKICERFESTLNSLGDTDASIKTLNGYINNLDLQIDAAVDDATLNFLERKKAIFTKQLAEFERYRENALSPYYKTPSLRAQIRVESDVMSEVGAFQKANLNAQSENGKIYPTRFMPALINQSIVTITREDANKDKATILRIDFPGLRYMPDESEIKDYPVDAHMIYLNGSMSGIVDLSAVGFCSTLKELKKDFPRSESELAQVFDAAVAVNLDYKVSVQAGIRLIMRSEIETVDFLKRYENSIANRNKNFTRSELYGNLVEGKVINALDIQIDDKGFEIDLADVLGANNEDEGTPEEAGPVARLVNQFISNYLNTVESKLEMLGVIEKIAEPKVKEIAGGTTTDLAGYQTICKTKSKWFGASKKKTCNTSPIYYQVNHDGLSKLIKESVENSVIKNTVQLETNQTTSVRHNSTFGM